MSFDSVVGYVHGSSLGLIIAVSHRDDLVVRLTNQNPDSHSLTTHSVTVYVTGRVIGWLNRILSFYCS
jgi:hypothetical protein